MVIDHIMKIIIGQNLNIGVLLQTSYDLILLTGIKICLESDAGCENFNSCLFVHLFVFLYLFMCLCMYLYIYYYYYIFFLFFGPIVWSYSFCERTNVHFCVLIPGLWFLFDLWSGEWNDRVTVEHLFLTAVWGWFGEHGLRWN